MSKRVTVTYEEFFASLPADEQRAIRKRSAELRAEYEAMIAADRAAGKVPPEDLPIDESIFGTIPRPTAQPRRKSPKARVKDDAGKLVAAK